MTKLRTKCSLRMSIRSCVSRFNQRELKRGIGKIVKRIIKNEISILQDGRKSEREEQPSGRSSRPTGESCRRRLRCKHHLQDPAPCFFHSRLLNRLPSVRPGKGKCLPIRSADLSLPSFSVAGKAGRQGILRNTEIYGAYPWSIGAPPGYGMRWRTYRDCWRLGL